MRRITPTLLFLIMSSVGYATAWDRSSQRLNTLVDPVERTVREYGREVNCYRDTQYKVPHESSRSVDKRTGGKMRSMRARITFYHRGEDRWTRRLQSSTGVRLQQGHCAVDPRRIPYGSLVSIPNLGTFRAVDTGSALRGTNRIDIFCPTYKEYVRRVQKTPDYINVTINSKNKKG